MKLNGKNKTKLVNVLLCFSICVILIFTMMPIHCYANVVIKPIGATAGTYAVTLDPNGGIVKTTTLSVTYKSTYGTLPTPTRTNYEFLGWYSLLYSGSKISKDSTVTKNYDHTIYARWRGIEKTLTLNANGGTVSASTVNVRYGTKLSSLPTPSRTNYNFAGWYTAATGGEKITSKTKYTEAIKTTLYAHWEEKTLKIAFIAFNGDEVIYKEVICGKPYGTLPTPVKKDEQFAGWYTWEDYGDMEAEPVTDKTIVTEKDKLKLFARWTD